LEVFLARAIDHGIVYVNANHIYFCLHIVPKKEHSVPTEGFNMHIEKELIESKIRILRDKGSENNARILEILSSTGPLIKYDLFKELKSCGHKNFNKETRYSTVSRRVDDLVNRGYLQPVGTRTIIVGKRKEESSKYGITWKGFIAVLTIETVADDIPKILEKNPQLQFPFPREAPIEMTKAIFSNRELKAIAKGLVTGYLRAIPKDLELLKSEQMLMYLFPAMTEAPEIRERFDKKDVSKLLQIPGVLNFISSLLDTTEKALENSLVAIRDLKNMLIADSQGKMLLADAGASAAA